MVMQEFKDLPAIKDREERSKVCALCIGIVIGAAILVGLILLIDAATIGAGINWIATIVDAHPLRSAALVLAWGLLLIVGAIVSEGVGKYRSMARHSRAESNSGVLLFGSLARGQ